HRAPPEPLMRSLRLFAVLLLFAAGPILLMGTPARALPELQPVHAVRIDHPIVVDGLLDEDVWTSAPAVLAFIEKDPDQGVPPRPTSAPGSTTPLRTPWSRGSRGATTTPTRTHSRSTSIRTATGGRATTSWSRRRARCSTACS